VAGVARFVAHVPLRWTDQDSYRHINHASTVTLLEQARIALLFDAASAEGLTTFSAGLLVAGLGVEYKRQVSYGPQPLRVTMGIQELRAASFRISYEMHDGPEADDAVAATAWTRMAMVDMTTDRPRRLTAGEQDFLKRWTEQR
jgi:acyl-CoA thioester hydrolase